MNLMGVQTFTIEDYENSRGILLKVQVRNLGMPSAVKTWTLMIQVAGQEPTNTSFLGIPDKMKLNGNPRRTVTPKDDLHLRTSVTPVSAVPIIGELFFLSVSN